jgi:hypothetical protein
LRTATFEGIRRRNLAGDAGHFDATPTAKVITVQ